ncbi:hypothetical protein HMI49_11720 [Corallococcus exercitus]|uniref:TIGR02646 family protein n=1 Tax=Corallococcus exercitus TaxID=2316736 RepID=A0A7Y4KHF3_9BACT|nr:hypothetical protein [Corallococcus exercitus]NOK33868.1 hypothetical protein [Corallococcus exercitus]
MIRRDRSRVAVVSALTASKGKGVREYERAKKHYESEEARAKEAGDTSVIKSFTFSAYSDASVKEALHALFEGKCAYCETLYAASQPMDVEHFRPKSEIRLHDGTVLVPGYWWLAAEWTNLLPSCIDCNRERNQVERHGDGSTAERKSGKECLFPLLDETKRVNFATRDKLEQEQPTLLDPCERNLAVENHLRFRPDGLIIAALDEHNRPSERGLRSIEVYGLNRTELVRARQLVLRFIQHRLLVVNALARVLDYTNHSADLSLLIEEIIDRELQVLREMRADDQPFAQMVRQVTDEAMKSFEESDGSP